MGNPDIAKSGQRTVNDSVIELAVAVCSGAVLSSADDSSGLLVRLGDYDAAIF